MTTVTLKGSEIEISGELPELGSKAPGFTLVKTDLSDVKLADFTGKKVILNIFPSIDTPVCSASVRKFNAEASKKNNTVVLCVSADLPFAHQRFCGAEGLEDVIGLSTFRDHNFGSDYGVTIMSGPLKYLMARAVVIIDEQGQVTYTELIPEIAQEPDYEAALAAL